MADIVCTPDAVYAHQGYWALSFSGTVQVGANNVSIYLPNTLLPTASEYGAGVLVDGMSWKYASPGNTPILQPFVKPSSGMYAIYFGRYSTADAVYGYVNSVGIPVDPLAATEYDGIGVFLWTTVAFDVYRVQAWGRFVMPPAEPIAQPVVVDGYKWPLQRRY